MEDSPQLQNAMPTPASLSAWIADMRKKKGSEYDQSLNGEYGKFISVTNLIALPSFVEAVNTIDVKSRKLIGVSSEVMEESLKNLGIRAKILASRSNAMWDIQMGTKEAASRR